ncbi:NAD-dependent protein deacylase Sir2A-like [Condylostylus longicornis]|uniref:NAD-dependent protein deacylase Sir2A-like n=1 Tax=Condylostylus longicornis TaxID=2530218 RepID=UPI00244E3299|nr:NAD-dependent protein deacylase Sir2A-like [Condylostylus longicornis]
MGQLSTYFVRKETKVIGIEDLADLIVNARYIVAVTGAGASAESGIPTFRDPSDGVWAKHSLVDCGTIWGFKRYPVKLWSLLSEFLGTLDPKPNGTHFGLTKLEAIGKLKCIVTQNVDHLHQEAGSQNVVEYHGTLMESVCLKCGKIEPLDKAVVASASFRDKLPPPSCEPPQVVGTSANVVPACNVPWDAYKNGAKIVEVRLPD